MRTCDEVLKRLKAACAAHYGKALSQDDSYGTRRLVRKGLLAAESAIGSVPPGDDARAYLDAVRAAVEKAREGLRGDPDDEDAWGPGAVNTILREIEDERASLCAEGR